ncbi:hypothetical protein OI70_14230 [Dickeya fangzhongdai]|nr:hypothetical protein OI70_14230 [Dickeya fangzhongdai]
MIFAVVRGSNENKTPAGGTAVCDEYPARCKKCFTQRNFMTQKDSNPVLARFQIYGWQYVT